MIFKMHLKRLDPGEQHQVGLITLASLDKYMVRALSNTQYGASSAMQMVRCKQQTVETGIFSLIMRVCETLTFICIVGNRPYGVVGLAHAYL